MRKYKQKLLVKLQADLRVLSLIDYKFRKVKASMVRKLRPEVDKMFEGLGKSEFDGLASIVDDTTVVFGYEGDPFKSTYPSLGGTLRS